MKELKMWCYKVLPLVYDDSLSYYEVLCKLKAKINELVGVIDDIPEAVKAYLNTDDFKAYIAQLVDSLKSGFVSVDDYGAKGDGETDDYEAIKEAASVAGNLGLPLIASGDKTYAVNPMQRINLWTDTNFNGATIKPLNTNYQAVFNLGAKDFETGTFIAADLSNYRLIGDKFRHSVIFVTSPMSFGPRYSNPEYEALYHCQTLVTDNNGYFINTPYYPVPVSGTYSYEKCNIFQPHITFENVVFENSENTAGALLAVNRPHVTVQNIVFNGDSLITGSEHNSIMFCHGLSYDVEFKNILGNVAWHRPNTGYVLGIYGGSDIVVDGLRATGLEDNIAWPAIGVSRPCNMEIKNCNMQRLDSHYESLGNINIHNCVVNSVGWSGGWGTCWIHDCTIIQDQNDNPNFWFGFRNDTPIAYYGTLTFERIDLRGVRGFCRVIHNEQPPTNITAYLNSRYERIIFKDCAFAQAQEYTTILNISDQYGVVGYVDIINCSFDAFGAGVGSNSPSAKVNFDRCVFNQYISVAGTYKQFKFNACRFVERVYYNTNKIYADILSMLNCNGAMFSGLDNIESETFVMLGCVFDESVAFTIDCDKMAVDNNLFITDPNNNQDSWNNVIV